VPADGLTVDSDRLVAGDVANIGGRTYRTLTGGPLTPGVGVQINVSGLPFPGGLLGRIPPATAAVVGVVVGLGVLVAAAFSARSRRRTALTEEDVVIEDLVALELKHDEARVSDDEYHLA